MMPLLDQFPSDQNIDNTVVAGFGGSAFSQLLMRMEALQLEPNEMRRIEFGVFSDLAEACAKCENKKRCEQDIADASAGTVRREWESFCPNVATLSAVAALPWFGKAESGSDASS